jgi:hypothetical protein
MKSLIKATTLFGLCLALHGCLYPESPGTNIVTKTIPLDHIKGEWLQMAPYRRKVGPASKSRLSVPRQRTKNLLFVASDDVLGRQLQDEITARYKREVRLEDALWWYYAPTIQKTYNHVLRIHWDGVHAQSLDAALSEMEALKQPYDVMLLAHGIPNHLLASPGQGVISYQELAEFKGLAFADTLYLQACFGDSLVQDFLDVGFKKVIASAGFSINLFYPDFYLEALSASRGDTEKAHLSVSKNFNTRFKMSPMHKKITSLVYAKDPVIQGDPKKYLEVMQMPEMYRP